MRYPFKLPAWALLALSIVGTAAGDEGSEATKSFDVNYNAYSDSNNLSSSVSYTVPLTDNLDFSASTALGNGWTAEDNKVTRDRNTNLSFNYDPTSPWQLGVGYANTYNLVHRPPSERYDEFKTESASNSVNSNLNYNFTDDLKTDLNLAVSDNLQKFIITGGEVPPPETSRNHNYGGGIDYNLTTATTMTVDYSGSISASQIEVSKTGTYPPQPPKPILSRKKTNNLSGSLATNKDITDSLNLNLSFNAGTNVGRDNLAPGLDSDNLNGNASGGIRWNPATTFSFTNTTSFDRRKDLYPNKTTYQKEFNEYLYDRYHVSFSDGVQLRIAPSDYSEITLSGDYDESENTLRDESGNLPPEDDTTNANSCSLTQSGKLTSNVDLALGEDITFHLTYYLSETLPQFIVYPTKNYRTRSNNLDGNIGFDWTEDLRVDVSTAMLVTLSRYADNNMARGTDSDDIDVNLNTAFIYDLSNDTTLEAQTDISKTTKVYTHPQTTGSDWARIKRHLSTKIRHEFGELFKPEFRTDFSSEREYYPASPSADKRHWRWSIYPGVEVDTSDNLTLMFTFSYSREEEDRLREPKPEDWELREYYTSYVSAAYVIAEGLSASFSSSNTHSVTTRDRKRRYKELPGESFFDLNAAVTYTF